MGPDNNARVCGQGQARLCYSVVTDSDIIIRMIYNAALGGATISDFIGYVLNYANSSSLVSENFWNFAYCKKKISLSFKIRSYDSSNDIFKCFEVGVMLL